MIPYGRQSIDEADVRAVVEVLHSDWLTQGPAVERFEQAMATYCGASFAVAVNSATSALHLACLSAGLGTGDRLWTSPNTFVASANCGLYCGAAVDFVDIDPRTYNLSVARLAAKLEQANDTGNLPKVLIPVHFSGQACEMAEIAELAGRYGVTLIEDASHAVGGSYRGARVGGCRDAAMTVFSFHPVKIITTGEGGMVLTNSEDLYRKLKLLRSHGITRDPGLMLRTPDGPWYYEQIELGFNYRMTDIQAALGHSQMKRIDEFITRRTALADRYDRLLADSGLTLPQRDPDCASAWHLYAVGWNEERSGLSRTEAFCRLHAAGIGVNVHYIPVHLQPYYRQLGFGPGQFPNAEAYYARTLSLPLHASLSLAQQDRVITELLKLLGQ